MNDSLKNIIELSNLDKEKTQFENDQNDVRKNLNTLEKEKEELQEKINAIKEKEENSKENIQKNNTYLQELNEKLTQISTKNAKVKTEKELKALSIEEDITKEQVIFTNDEISRYEKILENINSELDEQKALIKEIDKKIKKETKEVNIAVESISQQINDAEDKKKKLMKKIDEKTLSFYQKIRQWAKDSSVVDVEDKICRGCNIMLNEQSYIEVLKQSEMTICPNCGRIVYIKEPSAKEESA